MNSGLPEPAVLGEAFSAVARLPRNGSCDSRRKRSGLRRIAALAMSGRILFLVWCFFLILARASGAGFSVTNTNNSGVGSFRQALIDANASPGLDTISFQIAGSGLHTIVPLSALPAVTDPVVIDGTSQPGFAGLPLIELSGGSAGNNSGLRLLAGSSTVRGLIIGGFGADGIHLEGAGTNVIQGNFIGTDASGTLKHANAQEGVMIASSWNNLVGGLNAASANLISGNGDSGVYILNGAGNTVQGNLIGTALSGTNALGNTNHGVLVYNSSGNLLGGAASGARNVVSGNAGAGIYLYGSASAGNLVQGNYIGTASSGTRALGNGGSGVILYGASGNTVGGTNAGSGNLISGNTQAGVFLSGPMATNNLIQGNYIGTDLSGRLALGNTYAGITLLAASNNLIGGTLVSAQNVISGNKQDGIYLTTNSNFNRIQGNLIGLDSTGAKALSNAFTGMTLENAVGNSIGGAGAGMRNIVSGNAYYGIRIASASAGNFIAGNYIGSDASGNLAVSNTLSGVRMESAGNTVGGLEPGAGNLVSGNGQNGIFFVGTPASNNWVQGNFIGTLAGGRGSLGNSMAGIGVSGSPGNTIGGTTPAAANVISANGGEGIYLIGSTVSGTLMQGNIIGADVSGTVALGNLTDGIYMEDAVSNIIGGSVAGAGNHISGNWGDGICLTNATWTLVQGNWIGTKMDGVSALGNVQFGVECRLGSSKNTIGGSAPGAGNTIAFSGSIYAGVRIRPGSTNDSILGNSIFSNGALGIDLGNAGVTPNVGCGGAAAGSANRGQNFPVLTKALAGSGTYIVGTLNSLAGNAFTLQFFANPTPDSTGYGEGQIYLGQTNLITGGDCNAAFLMFFTNQIASGYSVSATATDGNGNTSEFGAGLAVQPQPRLGIAAGSARQVLLTWTNLPAGFALQQATNLSPPVVWSSVTNVPTLTNSQYGVALPVSLGTRFFRLFF